MASSHKLEHTSVNWNIALDRMTRTVHCHTAVRTAQYKRKL